MSNVGYATMQVTPSLRGMGGTLERQLNGQMRNAGKKAGGFFGTSFTSLAGRVIGAWAVGNVVNKVFDFLKEGFLGVNTTIENSTAALTQMLGSVPKAKALVQQFQDLASASATLDIKSAALFGRQLVAMGIDASKSTSVLKSLANAAAGTGTGLDGLNRIVRAYGQISAKGRVQTEELLQLQELGIPAIRLLAEGFGKTTGEMQAMVTKGLVPSNKALPILQKQLDKFYGDSDKVDTLSEAWDKLRTDMQGALGKATLPLFQKLSSALQGLANSNIVDKFGAGLATGLRVTGESLKTLFNAFKALSGPGGPKNFAGDIDSLAGAGGRLLAPMEKLGTALLNTFGNMRTVFRNVVTSAKNLFEAFGGVDTLKTAFAVLVGSLTPLTSALATVSGAVKSMTGFMAEHKAATQAVTASLITFYAVLQVGPLIAWAKALKVVTVATKAFAGAQTALAFVQLAAGVRDLATAWALLEAAGLATAATIGIVIAVVAALAVGFVIAYKKSETFRNIVNGALNGVKTAALAVANFFAGPFAGFFVSAWNAVTGAASATLHFFQALPGRVLGFLAALPGNLLHWGLDLAGKLAYAFGFAVGTVVKIIITLPPKVAQILAQLALAMARGSIAATQAAIRFFQQLPGRVAGFVTDMSRRAVSGIISAGRGMASAASTAAKNTLKFFRDLPGNAASALASLPGKVKDAVVDAGSWLYDAGKQVIEGLIRGIGAGAGAIAGVMKGLAGKVKSGFKDALGIHSPSRVFMGYGKFTAQGFAIGIKKNSGLAIKAANNMLGAGTIASTGAGAAAVAAGNQPLVGTINVDGSGAARDVADEVMFQIRRAARGGLYV